MHGHMNVKFTVLVSENS